MNNVTEQTMTRKCQNCRRTFTTVADWQAQYEWEANGFCTYRCESDYFDACNAFDRYGKP